MTGSPCSWIGKFIIVIVLLSLDGESMTRSYILTGTHSERKFIMAIFPISLSQILLT